MPIQDRRLAWLCWILAVALLPCWSAGLLAADDAADADEIPFLRVESGGHTAVCNWIGFTSDGMRLVSAGDDKVIRVWDITNPRGPRLERSIRGAIGFGADGMIYACAIAPRLTADGRALIACGGHLGPEDVDTEEATGQIRLFDLNTGELVGILNGHESNTIVNTLDFSSDGRYLASGGEDAFVYVWDLAPLIGENTPRKNWQPRADWLDKVHETYQILEIHEELVHNVVFHMVSDGSKTREVLASVSGDVLAQWESEKGEWSLVNTIEEISLDNIALSRDGKWFALTGVSEDDSASFVVFDLKGKPLFEKVSADCTVAPEATFSRDGQFLLLGGFPKLEECQVYSVPAGKLVVTFNRHDNTVQKVAFAPPRADGQALVASTGGESNDIWFWDPTTGETLGHLKSSGRPFYSVAFSPDGQQMAFGTSRLGEEDEAEFAPLSHIFDLKQMLPVPEFEQRLDEVAWVHAHLEHDSLTAEIRQDGQRLVTFDDGKRLARIDMPLEADLINCWCFLPDDTARLLIGTSLGLYGYDAETGEHLETLVGHEGGIWEMAISPDGRILATAGDDQTIRLWNAETLEMLLTYFRSEEGEWVIWNEEGYFMSSPAGDELFGWHQNRGDEEEAKFYSAAQFRDLYDRPELIRLIWQLGSVEDAEDQYNQTIARRRDEAPAATDRPDAPGHGQLTRSVNRIAPPTVTILEPGDQFAAAAERVTLKFQVDVSDEVRRNQTHLFLYVKRNGRPVGDWTKKRFSLAEITQRQGMFELEVDLQPGPQTLSVIVEMESGTRSEPALVTITRPAAPGAEVVPPQLIVLAIGVSEYLDDAWRDLEFADDDARALHLALDGQKGRAFADIHAKVLTDHEASRVGVLDGLQWAREQAAEIRENVMVCVCVAGHGTEENGQYFFVPHDFDSKHSPAGTAIRWADFLLELQSIEAPVILLMDTCHSGGVTGSGSESELSYSLTRTIATARDPRFGLNVFTSSLASQASLEDPAWDGHGAFTLAMLEALQDRTSTVIQGVEPSGQRGRIQRANPNPERQILPPDPLDRNQDGIISLDEFQLYVTQRVIQLTGGRQIPKAYFRSENGATPISRLGE